MRKAYDPSEAAYSLNQFQALLHLAGATPEAMGVEHWRAELTAFIGLRTSATGFLFRRTTPPGLVPSPRIAERIATAREPALTTCHRQLAGFLQAVAPDPIDQCSGAFWSRLELEIQPNQSRRGSFRVGGPLKDVVLYFAIEVWRRSPVNHVRVCDASCGKLFVRRGQQRFCSPRCKMRAYMRQKRREVRLEKTGYALKPLRKNVRIPSAKR